MDPAAPGALVGEPPAVPPRADWPRRLLRVLHSGSATKAAVLLLDAGGGPIVVKDVCGMHPFARAVYGRRVLAREERALQALAGVPEVVRLLGRVDRDALALAWLDAEPLRRHLEPARLRAACLALPASVAAMHARGVVHLDLRQKRNILVDRAGGVRLIDFQSALVLRRTGARGLLFRLLARLDDAAVLKFRERYVPDLLTPREARRARRARWLGRLWIFHRFGPLLRALLRRPKRSP